MTHPITVANHPIDPLALLTYLRRSLNPLDPLYSRLPAILDVFAIFQQLSSALIAAAEEAIREQGRVVVQCRQAWIADAAITKHGGLGSGQGKIVKRICERWGEDGDRGVIWSLMIRRCVRSLVIICERSVLCTQGFCKETSLSGVRNGTQTEI